MDDPLVRHATVHPRDKRWGLYVTGLGCDYAKAGNGVIGVSSESSLGASLGDFHLVWISQGTGEFESRNTSRVPITDSSIILVPPGCVHRYQPVPGSKWSVYWLNFNGDYPRSLLASGALQPNPVIQAVSNHSVQPLFERLMERLDQNQTGTAQLIAADLFQLIALAAGSSEAGKEAGQHESGTQLVSEAVAIIWSQGRESITVDELTEEMFVARRTLERAFRKQLAHGIHDEILLCRLERTTQLLADRSLSIEQVAVESGFGNVRSLRRAFVAAKGMSPQAYRNLLFSDPKAA